MFVPPGGGLVLRILYPVSERIRYTLVSQPEAVSNAYFNVSPAVKMYALLREDPTVGLYHNPTLLGRNHNPLAATLDYLCIKSGLLINART